MKHARDSYDRPLRDLRVSVTDHCNLRCPYCMPNDRTYRFLPRNEILTFEEISRVVRLTADLGVAKVRLTGGEPLVRRDLSRLVRQISSIRVIRDLAMTTNGTEFARYAEPLRDAGLNRVTFSLDSLSPSILNRMTGGRLDDPRIVLDAIDLAVRLGFQPVKVNMVVQRGVNDSELTDMARRMLDLGAELRFIEFMDVGTLNQWQESRVFSKDEILTAMAEAFSFEPIDEAGIGVARRFRYATGGAFGVIASVSAPFCGGCTRLRLSADGHLYTCLFGNEGFDLRPLLRGRLPDRDILEAIDELWSHRSDRYSEQRKRQSRARNRVEMFQIGG